VSHHHKKEKRYVPLGGNEGFKKENRCGGNKIKRDSAQREKIGYPSKDQEKREGRGNSPWEEDIKEGWRTRLHEEEQMLEND